MFTCYFALFLIEFCLFKKKTIYVLFCLTHSLIDRCQIGTDTLENVSKFVWKPFKSSLLLHK